MDNLTVFLPFHKVALSTLSTSSRQGQLRRTRMGREELPLPPRFAGPTRRTRIPATGHSWADYLLPHRRDPAWGPEHAGGGLGAPPSPSQSNTGERTALVRGSSAAGYSVRALRSGELPGVRAHDRLSGARPISRQHGARVPAGSGHGLERGGRPVEGGQVECCGHHRLHGGYPSVVRLVDKGDEVCMRGAGVQPGVLWRASRWVRGDWGAGVCLSRQPSAVSR